MQHRKYFVTILHFSHGTFYDSVKRDTGNISWLYSFPHRKFYGSAKRGKEFVIIFCLSHIVVSVQKKLSVTLEWLIIVFCFSHIVEFHDEVLIVTLERFIIVFCFSHIVQSFNAKILWDIGKIHRCILLLSNYRVSGRSANSDIENIYRCILLLSYCTVFNAKMCVILERFGIVFCFFFKL